jgi:hypothetical protein
MTKQFGTQLCHAGEYLDDIGQGMARLLGEWAIFFARLDFACSLFAPASRSHPLVGLHVALTTHCRYHCHHVLQLVLRSDANTTHQRHQRHQRQP